MRSWGTALALSILWIAPAVAGNPHAAEGETTLREVTLAPSVPPSDDAVHLTIIEVNFPGLSERSACRLQVLAVNEGGNRIGLRTLLATFSEANGLINNWLVPTGDLDPGGQSLRTYSCKIASTLKVSKESTFGWPHVCDINGNQVSPCPVALKISSNLPLGNAP